MMEAWSHSSERILRAASMKKVERQKVSVVIFILFSVFYFVYGHLVMGVWSACGCMSTICVPGTQDGQKRTSDSLELQAVVSSYVHSGNCSWAVC